MSIFNGQNRHLPLGSTVVPTPPSVMVPFTETPVPFPVPVPTVPVTTVPGLVPVPAVPVPAPTPGTTPPGCPAVYEEDKLVK